MPGPGTAMATKISSSSSSSRTCLCSPTSHPGSFRCSRHRRSPATNSRPANRQPKTPIGLTSNISATSIKTSLLKDFLMQIIRPSGDDLQRRRNFQPKPTRFSLMNSAKNVDHGLVVS